jgi:hypothetical protein
MQIEPSEEQFQNASRPISVSLESDSNVTCDSEAQSLKLESLITSTLAGMQIDFRDEQFQKAHSSIRNSVDPASKPTVNRCLQCEKQ